VKAGFDEFRTTIDPSNMQTSESGIDEFRAIKSFVNMQNKWKRDLMNLEQQLILLICKQVKVGLMNLEQSILCKHANKWKWDLMNLEQQLILLICKQVKGEVDWIYNG